MALFDDFQHQDLERIISLPYRVGIWMGRVDNDRGTKRDEKREERALVAILEHLAKQDRDALFVAHVTAETLKQERHWPVWAQAKGLAEDIAAAGAVIARVTNTGTANQYKKALFQIALTVAQAHGDMQHTEALLGEIAARFSDRFFDPLEKNPENISAAEKAALQKLRDALKG